MAVRVLIFLFMLLMGSSKSLLAQTTTQPDKSTSISGATEKPIPKDQKKGNVMIIPFDPRLYMSEIDKEIWQETKLSFNQIREAFRNGLSKTLELVLKREYAVISLLADSSKTAEDIAYIYKSIEYKYDLVVEEKGVSPASAGPGASTGKKDQAASKIVNGELVVGVNYDKRFMNTIILNRYLLPYLHKKYKSTLFVFINELDIKNDLTKPYDSKTAGFRREIAVHYSIFDKTGKSITSGVATTFFSPSLNQPKKIVDNHFPSVVKIIAEKLSKPAPNQQPQTMPPKK